MRREDLDAATAELERKAEHLDPAVAERVRKANARLVTAREKLDAAVKGARRAGASWQFIGDLLGVSRQAAFERFGKS